MTHVFIFLTAFFLVSEARAASPSNIQDIPVTEVIEGLPACLDTGYLTDPDTLAYSVTVDTDTFMLPLSDKLTLTLNGAQIPSNSLKENRMLRAFFPDRHYVSIPPSEIVTAGKDSRGRVSWSFPEGANFIHEIYFDPKGSATVETDRSTLLEVRVERMISRAFRYGNYEVGTPDNTCPSGLRLRTSRARARTLSAPLSAYGSIKVHYRPLAPNSCVSCHGMESSHGPQPSLADSEPCAFVDPSRDGDFTIHASIRQWEAEYLKKFGHSPVK